MELSALMVRGGLLARADRLTDLILPGMLPREES